MFFFNRENTAGTKCSCASKIYIVQWRNECGPYRPKLFVALYTKKDSECNLFLWHYYTPIKTYTSVPTLSHPFLQTLNECTKIPLVKTQVQVYKWSLTPSGEFHK